MTLLLWQEQAYEEFVSELGAIRNAVNFEEWSLADQTDYWALTSALNRVYWELHIFRPMWRDPGFYLQQVSLPQSSDFRPHETLHH